MAEIKFEILEKIGELSTSAKGWTKEVNIVSWNDRPGKYDIREWDESHQKMGKGLTLSKEEVKQLKDILNSIEL